MSSTSTIKNSKNTDMLIRSYSDRSYDRNRVANSNRERDYDRLKQKCEIAMQELMMLRRQYGQTVQRYDQTRKELEYYCSQNQESSSFDTKLAAKKQILNRSEQDIPEVDTASGDSLNDHFIPYDSIPEDYEALRKAYENLHTTHSAAVEKMNMMKDEINQLKKQRHEFFKERDIAFREKYGFRQQYLASIHQLNLTVQERNDLQDAIQKVQQQNKKAVIEKEAAVTYSVKINKELKELNKAHGDAVKEYRLIMSERDIVNNEIEKLSEDLSQAYNKNKLLENEIKSCRDEKTTLQLYVESLKREISSALHDRDKALKECNAYQERFGAITSKHESQREFKSYLNYDFTRERERKNRNDLREQDASLDLFNSCQKERIDNLDLANQEIERLRNLANKYHNELDESLEEAKISKRRRDWAFSERDKIVLERESIRTLCDSLRRQLDDAVSKLARVIRDCGDIMKRKSDTAKNHNDFKETIGSQLEKEVHLLKLQATGCYSQDSAIDTDLQDCDTEILNIDLGVLGTNEDLGIGLLGGRDSPLYPNDNAIYISSVNKGCVSARKLRVNDCILRLNSLDCTSISKQLVLETMKSLSSATLVVSRRKPASTSRSLFTTQLKVNNYDHGISLETGVYISKITPGSMAAKDGNLDVGDRVLSINNTTVDNVKHSKEAMLLLNGLGDVLTITTMKSTYCAGNCFSSPNYDIYKKYTNSTTQTDKSSYSIHQEPYKKPQYVQSIRVMLPEKSHRNPSPINNSISERDQKDAIAELDSVTDTFKPHPALPTTTKYLSRHRKSKELDKISGTWPKARSSPVIEHGTGTILHPRKNKERWPLSTLFNNLPSRSSQNISKNDVSSIDFSVRSGKVGKDVMDYYVKKITGKYKYSITDGNAENILAARPTSHNMFGQPSTNAHHFLTPRYSRYSQSYPTPRPESMLNRFEPPHSHVSQFHHSRSPSLDMLYNRHTNRSPRHIMTNNSYRGEDMPESYHGYKVGTFPRKSETPRFRITSNPSVTNKSSGGAVGISTGSINRSISSERDSPMLTFKVEVLSPGQISMPANKRQTAYDWASKYFKRPLPRGVRNGPLTGELRRISIEKSGETLGIKIFCVDSSGVFVSSVTNEHSVAYKVGIQVGDQLLEVCGINMRYATYQLAENILEQCGNSVTMLVQYSLDEYQELQRTKSLTCSGSETTTPCSSLTVKRKSTYASVIAHGLATLTRRKSDRNTDNRSLIAYEPHYFIMETRKCSDLGISLVGGNAVGIFVQSVNLNSLAYNAGLRTGDCILECNGTDLREATAEEAAFELAKPAEKVTVLAQYLIDKYNEIKDKPGDSFYIRALFDRTIELSEASSNSSQLQFRKDDILYVDNTMYNGIPGNWRAWLVDHNGYKQQVGIIPSKYKVEEELVIRSSGEKVEGDARRATIRSFFKRENHQRSSSKELACFSNINLGWYSSDSGNLHDDATVMPSYQRVIRLNSEPSILTTDLIKLKSTEQVKLDNNSRPSHDKMSVKAGKDMYDHALKLGSEHRHYISAAIPYMCTEIKAADDLEQSETFSVSSPTPL